MDTKKREEVDQLIGTLLKTRKKRRISQTRLSEMTGIPPATISRVESFKTIPTLDVIIKLGNALGLQLSFKEK